MGPNFYLDEVAFADQLILSKAKRSSFCESQDLLMIYLNMYRIIFFLDIIYVQCISIISMIHRHTHTHVVSVTHCMMHNA